MSEKGYMADILDKGAVMVVMIVCILLILCGVVGYSTNPAMLVIVGTTGLVVLAILFITAKQRWVER